MSDEKLDQIIERLGRIETRLAGFEQRHIHDMRAINAVYSRIERLEGARQ
jgi:archaellum component FlaC